MKTVQSVIDSPVKSGLGAMFSKMEEEIDRTRTRFNKCLNQATSGYAKGMKSNVMRGEALVDCETVEIRK